jgi:hypothetical protein
VGSNEHSVGLLGVPVEEFELDLDHVVEALAPLVDVVVAAVTAVHFAGGLSPHQGMPDTEIMSGNAIICWDTIVLER